MPKRRASTKGLRPELSDRGIWQAVGSIAGERIRKSLGTRDEGKAVELCAAYEARLWKRHTYGEEAVRTFEEAAESYMKAGGEARFLTPIIKHFKGRALGSIKPAEIRSAVVTLYPKAAPATRNRQGIVPARAVIMHGHDLGWCGSVRIKQFEVPKSRKHKPVDRAWIDAFMAEADRSKLPHLSAFVLFVHQTGARLSEAARLCGEHVDLSRRVVVLEKTKTDEWVVKNLTAELVARISALTPRDGYRVFGYTDPKAINRVAKRVAVRAGIDPLSSHSFGRHSFGTNILKLTGGDIKATMDAGNWKSVKLFMETYVHTSNAGENVAAKLDAQTGPIDILKPMSIKRRLGNARKH
jgi:integrase